MTHTPSGLGVIMDDLKPGMVTVVGVPSDENSSYMRGAALAPPRIREVLHSGAANLCAENGIDLAAETRWQDLGDLALADGIEAFEQIEATVGDLIERGVRVLALGGDHAITYPIMKAYGPRYKDLTVLHLEVCPQSFVKTFVSTLAVKVKIDIAEGRHECIRIHPLPRFAVGKFEPDPVRHRPALVLDNCREQAPIVDTFHFQDHAAVETHSG